MECGSGGEEDAKVGVKLLLKQVGIPIGQEKFLLVRGGFGNPWRGESVEEEKKLSSNFLNTF